ncbi:MAG: zinc ribbon domain-containing protein [Ignavibacteria bacterium]|nr:zinc ribbon domain-containing protein [Ignavibacteria bacterium]
MPTYHYRCKKCSHEFEELQKMSDDALTYCPECETNSLSRIIGSGAGLLFKGNGYYQTDYKKNSTSESVKKKSDTGTSLPTSDTTTTTPSNDKGKKNATT